MTERVKSERHQNEVMPKEVGLAEWIFSIFDKKYTDLFLQKST